MVDFERQHPADPTQVVKHVNHCFRMGVKSRPEAPLIPTTNLRGFILTPQDPARQLHLPTLS